MAAYEACGRTSSPSRADRHDTASASDGDPVFYRPEKTAQVDSISPSTGKPAWLVEQWTAPRQPVEVHGTDPVTMEAFYRIHDRAFVDGVLSLKIRNGLRNNSAKVADSLPFTSGSMLAAAKAAITNGRVAVAPCSGLHQAHFAQPAGFCTFNDPHIAVPQGGWLTSQHLWQSGRILFETARYLGLPVAWNVRGGDQEPLSNVMRIQTNTLHGRLDVHLRREIAQ